MSRASSRTSSSTEPQAQRSATFRGDPNCPVCAGIGFVRHELPIDHPDFGRVEICSCRAGEVAQGAYQRVSRLSNLQAFKQMTFETFKIHGRLGLGDEQIASLNLAFNQAQNFARGLNGWLLLLGGYGCGKTHLAAAIANFAVDMGVPTLFLTVPDLLDWLRYSYESSDDTFESRFEEIRNIKLLVLDDLGTQNATAWASEKLYQVFNHRYVNRLPVVVTSNQVLEEIEGRIQSRLRDPELVSLVRMYAPDYRSPTSDSSQPRLSSLELYGRMTFGSFSLRENERLDAEERANLARAFREAQEFADDPRGWLVLSGPYGCGKTHLAAAIGNYNRSRGSAPIFRSVPDLLDHLRSTFSPTSTVTYDKVFEEVRSARLLILDDLDTQNASPWAREKLYQILNHRYMAELPTVITTASTLDKIDERIRSRMLDTRLCTFFGILAPAYILRDEKPKRAAPARTSTRGTKKPYS
jgi:DNA replication protein DnaC